MFTSQVIQWNVFLILCLSIGWQHKISKCRILKFDFLESEKSFWSEIKIFSLVWQTLLFRLKKQTSKNVADTTFKTLVPNNIGKTSRKYQRRSSYLVKLQVYNLKVQTKYDYDELFLWCGWTMKDIYIVISRVFLGIPVYIATLYLRRSKKPTPWLGSLSVKLLGFKLSRLA